MSLLDAGCTVSLGRSTGPSDEKLRLPQGQPSASLPQGVPGSETSHTGGPPWKAPGSLKLSHHKQQCVLGNRRWVPPPLGRESGQDLPGKSQRTRKRGFIGVSRVLWWLLKQQGEQHSLLLTTDANPKWRQKNPEEEKCAEDHRQSGWCGRRHRADSDYDSLSLRLPLGWVWHMCVSSGVSVCICVCFQMLLTACISSFSHHSFLFVNLATKVWSFPQTTIVLKQKDLERIK